MILWFKHLPQPNLNLSKWTPYIQNPWFRKHYMKLVYLLQIILFLIPVFVGGRFPQISKLALFLICIFVFIIHEILHIIVINKKGDMCLTYSRLFFWIYTNAVLSKPRFLVFMSCPFILLSVVPFIVSFFLPQDIKSILLFVSWINALISASDIINSFFIVIKPKNSVFCRGYFRLS